jgi:hypothetical protein
VQFAPVCATWLGGQGLAKEGVGGVAVLPGVGPAGRRCYEDLDTGSLWAGYNVDGGSDLVYQLTPMLGVVFGHLNGIAPGYEVTLAYKRFVFSGQGEYVFDATTHSNDFFYAWTELSYRLIRHLRLGVAMQHTKDYQTQVDVQRGLLIGFSYGRFDFAAYVFNVDKPDPPVVLGIAATF